jgi:hypothetical protein
MGAKGSKSPPKAEPTNTAPRVVHVSADEIIDPSDPAIFPEKVRNELMAVKQEISPNQLFLVKEFTGSSELVKWLHASKSYFDYEPNTENENTNYESNENNNSKAYREEERRRTQALRNALTASLQPKPPVNTSTNNRSNALVNRLARLRTTKGGKGVERDKNPFLWKLYAMCSGGDIRDQFLANLLEVSDRILLAFLTSGHIAGFSIFGEDQSGGTEGCLHRYVTCVGPRKLGIGAGIVKEFHAIAKREGYPCVTLGASSAKGFHLKQGYTYTGKNTSEGPEMIYRIPQEGGKKRKTRRKQRK